MHLNRRLLLGTLSGATLLAACGQDGPVTPAGDGAGPTSYTYGDDPSQFGELTLPGGTPRGVVVVVHGGFWKAEYDLSLGRPLAASLAEEGWAAWNIEYRRLGPASSGGGGGTPATFDDVAAAIDRLADLDLDLSTVVTLGHSAGGHLAVWAAGRTDPTVKVTAAISQAGVLDLVGATEANLGGGAAVALLGHPATEADAAYDPLQQVPLDVPVHCVHGDADTIVPPVQSETYVDAAVGAGAEAELVMVDGDHFVLIDPASEAWSAQLEILDGLG